MSLRVRERLGVADVMTLLNASLGMVAMTVAVVGEPQQVARLILLAAVADGLDGIIARRVNSTEAGPYLDAMADIVSFGTAPALFLFVTAQTRWEPLTETPELYVLSAAVAALFLVFSLVRTVLYTVYVEENEKRPGIQNTLAASILAAVYLSGLTFVPALFALGVLFSGLMVAPVRYPKLSARDALVMGTVQMGAILVPTVAQRLFPRALLVCAVGYMTLAPWFYWEG